MKPSLKAPEADGGINIKKPLPMCYMQSSLKVEWNSRPSRPKLKLHSADQAAIVIEGVQSQASPRRCMAAQQLCSEGDQKAHKYTCRARSALCTGN